MTIHTRSTTATSDDGDGDDPERSDPVDADDGVPTLSVRRAR